jgi:GSH-dependent disulfide-bond oxidoreductase
MAGQLNWFHRASAAPGRDQRYYAYPINRFYKEVRRLYGVLERQLAGRDFIADAYSIADMACWPWVDAYHHHLGDFERFANIRAWHARMAARPAVERALSVAAR